MPSHFNYTDSVYRFNLLCYAAISVQGLFLLIFGLLIEWCKIRVNIRVDLLKCAWSIGSGGVMRASILINVDQNLKLTIDTVLQLDL
jgi:hypothetical protein